MITTWQDPRLSEQGMLRAIVRAHGGAPENAHAFDQDDAALLPYASLGAARASHLDNLAPVLGIYEWQEAPLIALVDGDRLKDTHHLARIRRVIALRGDIPYLGVAAGGRLDIHVVALDKRKTRRVDMGKLAVEQEVLLPYLASFRPDFSVQRSNVSDVVLKLLDNALHTLTESGLSEADAISLAGRTLFARFLSDRDLPLGPHMADARSDTAFADPVNAEKTSRWLDTTFNGNLLPLTKGIFAQLSPDAFGVLVDIMRRAPDGQMSLGWAEKWDNLHFAHIPVGILSQVYERYLKTHEPNRQKNEGSFYTPALIADLMVRATLSGLEPEHRHEARFLDPAAGAGVFLITAFRHLVAERWQRDGVRPDTKVLREILYDQIAGFDVNEAALRFAALGLYLISIELDPEPEPVSKLKFHDLRGSVLSRPVAEGVARVRKTDVPLDKLGSIGPGVPQHHLGRYDVVIGNPPWKAGAKVPGWKWVKQNSAEIAKGRLQTTKVPDLLPNEALDLPFVWRAIEWAKPDGQIAFALHGRLLFEQGDGMPEARAALFKALEVTSVLNGAGLRKTRVWPQITAPFCILFARNRLAAPGATIRFVSPHVDAVLNKSGLIRIDAAHAPLVRLEDLVRQPERLKILFRGSELDLQIYDRILEAGHPTLSSLTTASGTGLQTLKPSSRVRKNETLPGADASYLKGWPYLANGVPPTLIDAVGLPTFEEDRIHDPREERIFLGPLLIVGETLRANAEGLSPSFSRDRLVYGEAFYGYSFHGIPDAQRRALYGYLMLRSSFSRWWALMRSGKYGFERDLVEKTVIDALPLPPLECLDKKRVDTFEQLGSAILLGAEPDREALEDWVTSVLSLTEEDRRVIDDTLAHALTDGGQGSLKASDFLAGMHAELGPWVERFNHPVAASPLDPVSTPGWCFVELRAGKDSESAGHPDLGGFIRAADALGSTEIYHHDGDGRLFVGMLARPRYWTYSQGVRAARHLIWKHVDFVVGSGRTEAVQS